MNQTPLVSSPLAVVVAFGVTLFMAGCRCGDTPGTMKQPKLNSSFAVQESDGMFSIRSLSINSGPIKNSVVQVAAVKGYTGEDKVEHDFQAVIWSLKPNMAVKASIHHSVATASSDEVDQPVYAAGAAPVVMTRRTRIGTSRSSIAIEPLATVERVYFIEAHGANAAADVVIFGGGAGGANLAFTLPVGMFCEYAPTGPLAGVPVFRKISSDAAAQKFADTAKQVGLSAGIPIH